MADPRYSRTAFWTVKIVGLLALLIVIWNVAKSSGRQEILDKRPVQLLTNGNPVCVWGDEVYFATEIKPATKTTPMRMMVKIKRDQGGN